ncbi:hypothetical protein ES708_28485 [subsurface metagenome]
MAKVTELGIEVFPGFTVPWDWLDGMLCNLIEKGDAEVITDPAVGKLDVALQKIVDNTDFKFDNVGKAKLEKAFTLSAVKRFMPELLPNP